MVEGESSPSVEEFNTNATLLLQIREIVFAVATSSPLVHFGINMSSILNPRAVALSEDYGTASRRLLQNTSTDIVLQADITRPVDSTPQHLNNEFAALQTLFNASVASGTLSAIVSQLGLVLDQDMTQAVQTGSDYTSIVYPSQSDDALEPSIFAAASDEDNVSVFFATFGTIFGALACYGVLVMR